MSDTVFDLGPFFPKSSTLTVLAVRALSPPPSTLTTATVAIIASVAATVASHSAPLHLWQPRVGPSTLCLPPSQRQQKQQPSLPHSRRGPNSQFNSPKPTTLLHASLLLCAINMICRGVNIMHLYVQEICCRTIRTCMRECQTQLLHYSSNVMMKAIIIIDLYTNIDNRSRCPLGYKPCEHVKIESSLILPCSVHRAYSQMDIGYRENCHNEGSGFGSWLRAYLSGCVRIWVGVQK